MIGRWFSTKVLFLLVGAAVVTGCATHPDNVAGYRSISENEGLPVFDVPAFMNLSPVRAMHSDDAIRQDYARYEAGGTKAELFYISTHEGPLRLIALHHPYDSTNIAERFNYFTSRNIESPKGVGITTDLATFWFRIISVPGERRQCAVFNSEWDVHAEDALLRPDKVMFGYYCPPPGQTLDRNQAGAIIDGLRVRGINSDRFTSSTALPVAVTGDVEKKLSDLARGNSTTSEWGSQAFPFDMAVYYDPSGPTFVD